MPNSNSHKVDSLSPAKSQGLQPTIILGKWPEGCQDSCGSPQRALCDQLSQTPREGGNEEAGPGTPSGFCLGRS